MAIQLAAAARSKGDLQAALIVNALADHYLEDFLAAGHVATPREDFHDFPSALVHDVYNQEGIPFRVRRDSPGWLKIRPLAQAIQSMPGSADEVHGYQTVASFAAMVDEPQGEDRTFLFMGDGRLECNKSQRTYILLQAIRSLGDVITSYVTRRPVDELLSTQWSFTPPSSSEPVSGIDFLKAPPTSPRGETASGEYDLHAMNVKFPKLPGIILSFSQVPSADQQALRLDYRPDVTASGAAVTWSTPGAGRGGWVIASNGVSFLHSPHLRALDVHTFAVASSRPWPFHVHVFGRVGAGLYDNAGRLRVRVNGGFGAEKAFSLVAVRAEIEKVYFAHGDDLGDHWVPSLGVSLMVPLTWAAHLKPHQACQ
jgi:hypothetical protein